MMPGSEKTTGLSSQQMQYVRGIAIEGKTKAQSARDAGYSPTTSSAMIEKSTVLKNALTNALFKRGLTEDYVAKRIMEGSKAYDTHYITSHGRVTEIKRSPNFATREKYLRTALEIQGYLKNNNIENLNIGLISVPEAKANAEGWNDYIKPENQIQESEQKKEQPL